jgi:hypothetical protein
MSEPLLLDAIAETATVLAAIESSIWMEDREAIERLTRELHLALSRVGGVPQPGDERAMAEHVHAVTIRLEKLLADRIATHDSVPLRRKVKTPLGRIRYAQ